MPDTEPRKSARPGKKPITLALQGGASHGAFTWGVLDRLAEEPSLDIRAVSGTSAGALNAAVFVAGFQQNGAAGAKQKLHDFWRSVSRAGHSVFNPYSYIAGWPMLGTYVFFWTRVLSQVWSPYDNLFYSNRLKSLLEEAVGDFKHLARIQKPALFICATNVRTNQRKIFWGDEICVEALLASACLPSLFQAVSVNGDDYWDGGYMGNPALSPLRQFADDILIIGVNPINRQKTPRLAADIMDRLNEITFNASLILDLEKMAFVNKLLQKKLLNQDQPESKEKSFKEIYFHLIEAEKKMSEYPEYTKSDTSWGFLIELKSLGRETASKWIDDHIAGVGVSSTFDVEKLITQLHTHPQGLRAS
ncbi:MAG: patatin-like phospholipase family protein [Desulfobacteraceae bacterium]|nr:MAG: patatin-like phospholipase family protein [Desulfobacteraceae bacterium]